MSNRKINILFIIDLLWDAGGTEKHLYYLTKYLNKDRFNCFIVTFDLKEMFVKKIRSEGIRVYHIPVRRLYTLNAFFKAFELRKILKESMIDIVQTFHFESDTYGVLVSKLSGISRIISSRRDMADLKKPRQVFLNKIMNRYINHFIMVCNAVGEKVYKTESVPEDRMITIYNGVDLKTFNPNNNSKSKKELGIGEKDFVVGTSAIFRPEKAYHIFFEGIERVIPYIENLRVLVLGSGTTKGYFEDYCSEGPLKDKVRFVGYMKDVENYLPLMDVFCYVPNKNEGFSNAILEAMATGKPVIATDVGGNAEAVLNNETGFIIPPDDTERLAEAIIYLYNNPPKREEMGRRSRERAEQLFSLEKMVGNHEKFYEEVFKGSFQEK